MNVDKKHPKTVIAWGAGATNSLGAPTTNQIGLRIAQLANWVGEGESGTGDPLGFNYKLSIEQRMEPLKYSSIQKAHLKKLLIILCDGDGVSSVEEARSLKNKTITKLCEKWRSEKVLGDGDEDSILNSINEKYDWLGLKSLIQITSRTVSRDLKTNGINYQDLLTIIEQLHSMGSSVPTVELFSDDRKTREFYVIDPIRIQRIKNTVNLLAGTLISFGLFDDRGEFKSSTDSYRRFIKNIHEVEKKRLSGLPKDPDIFAREMERRSGFLSDIAFIDFNWDGVLPWLFLNENAKADDLNLGGREFKLYVDMGAEMGYRPENRYQTKGEDKTGIAFYMNESSCQRANSVALKGVYNIALFKVLQVHGALNWRQCSRCGKVFSTIPAANELNEKKSHLPPFLLPELNPGWNYHSESVDKPHWESGLFSTLSCIFCDSLTEQSDVPLLTQTVIKSDRHYFQKSLFHEMGQLISNAEHFILMGYSLPPDDLINRCYFLSALAKSSNIKVTVVNFDSNLNRKSKMFYYKSDIEDDFENLQEQSKALVTNLFEVFNAENIRFCFLGFPKVLGKNSLAELEELLHYPD